jgi:type IV secretory pathway component VirB8
MYQPTDPSILTKASPDTLVRSLVNRSERIAWWVTAGVGAAFVLCEVVPRVFPKPPTEVRVPVYINALGEAKLESELLGPETLTAHQALEKRDLRTWALARYRYHYALARQDWYTVQCFSSQPVFADYDAQFRNPKAEGYIDSEQLRDGMVRDVRWIGAVLTDPEPNGDKQARVTLEVVTTYRGRQPEQQPPAQRVVVNARYRYEPALTLPQECGDQNHMRFVMLSSRGDTEITAKVPAQGVTP